MNQKRYQVFISSTYEDLKEERQKVTQAILKLKSNNAVWENDMLIIGETQKHLFFSDRIIERPYPV